MKMVHDMPTFQVYQILSLLMFYPALRFLSVPTPRTHTLFSSKPFESELHMGMKSKTNNIDIYW